MAGFLTAEEAASELTRLSQQYPRWMGPATAVATSREGRPIQLLCVTKDREGCDGQSERPAVLYTALLHAREPISLTCLLHFLRALLRRAEAGEAGAAALLGQRKLLFLPTVNPDGWAWNERARPRGGGMKRKNGLRSCGRGVRPGPSDGVDLNRNFGYKWAYSRQTGSSAQGCDEEYRGKEPFSEPETRAVRDVATLHGVRAVLHWHGWGNSLAFPFSYDWRAALLGSELDRYQALSPRSHAPRRARSDLDDERSRARALAQEVSGAMTARNGYARGRAWESVGYHANGEADDWGFGERGLLSLSLEVGNARDGFWPSPSRIGALAAQSLWPAQLLAHRAGPVLQLHSLALSDAMSGGASLQLSVHNAGLGELYGAWQASSRLHISHASGF